MACTMSDLTEMQQRIVAELEEAWEQNVFSMLNTIIDPTGDAREVSSFQQALQGLIERDHVIMGLEGVARRSQEELGKSASLELISNLGDWFRFDTADSHWTLSKGDFRKERIPMIYLSSAGQQKAVAILTQRGYQWWRQKK
jgi:hypothetical protein